jgi:ligand-binding sensor domain-containing protein/signal transduction histidine kinase
MPTTLHEASVRARPLISLVLLLILLTSLFSGTSLGQKKSIKQYVHDRWTSQNGMPQNSASDIVQTKDGYLWFATQEGLARFDGVKFTVFDRANTDALPDSWILRLGEDSTGALWIRVQGFAPGITRYENGVFTHFTTANGLPNNTLNARAVDKEGGIWFATLGGLSYFKGGKFSNYTVKDGLPSDTVNSLGLDSKNNLWMSTPKGLARYSNGKIETLTGTQAFPDTTFFRVHDFSSIFEDKSGTLWMHTPRGIVAFSGSSSKLYTKKDGLSSLTVNDVYQDSKGNIWFATASGLSRFQNGRFTTLNASPDVDENTILSIREDNEGSLWLVTGKGIKRYANGKFESYKQEDGLSDNVVQTMMVDREGSIWLGTFGGGIDRFRNANFITYSARTGLSFDNVQPVIEDSKGALWIGSNSAGLNRFKDGTVTSYTSKNGLPANDVRDLAEDKEGNIWISTTRGLVSFKNGVFTSHSKQTAIGMEPLGNAMVQLKSGSFLVASFNRVFTEQNSKFIPFFRIDSTANRPNFIQDIWEDSRGMLWIACIGNLYWFKDGKARRVTAEDGFEGNWVQTFYEDKDGTIWLGVSSHGFARYKDGKFAFISPKQGLFDFNGYVLFEDSQGYLWSSCNKGVFRVSKKELNDVADGRSSMVHCTSYGEPDGMESRECNGGYSPSGFQLHDGRLAFASVKGVVIVNPLDIKLNPIPPPVVVERLLADGTSKDLNGRVSLSAGTNRLEFHYAGLSYIGGDKVRFKYKLEGADPEWIDAGGRREAYYTNVSPGEYTFRVIAANSDGIWNEKGAALGFELKPYFYQTKWFLAIAILAFLTIGPSIYYWRVRSLKQREADLGLLVNKRTEELQKTLTNLKNAQHQLVLSEKMASLGQLTAGIAHEIKNPLNFITNFAVLSKELAHELREELAHERYRVDPQRATEITEILDNLEQNVRKIDEHGKRADSIVRGMLLHSRGKAGERQDTDLNALLSEYTNLAYHGMRAQDQSFNVKIETDFDPTIGKVSIVPQDLSRAFLNIVNNACYAANDKRRLATNGFSPTVRVSAKNLGTKVEIRIRDNGNGIPKDVMDKIFNPFFTTKPAGVGTGLGLSITYDIIREEHKGEITVNTQPGEFTEFVIVIPKDSNTGDVA